MADKKRSQRDSRKEAQIWRSRNAELAEEFADELDIHPPLESPSNDAEPLPDLPAAENIDGSNEADSARVQQADTPQVSPKSNDDVYSALAQAAVNPEPPNDNTAGAQEDDALGKAERQAMAVLDQDLYGMDMEAGMEEDIGGVGGAAASRNPHLTPDDVKRQTGQDDSNSSFVAQQESIPVQSAGSDSQTFAQVNESAPLDAGATGQPESLDTNKSPAEPTPEQRPNQPSSYPLGSLEYEDQADFGPLYDAGYDMEVGGMRTNPLSPDEGLMRSAQRGLVPADPATLDAWTDFDIRGGARRPAQDEAAAFFKLSGGPFPSLLRSQDTITVSETTTEPVTDPTASDATRSRDADQPQPTSPVLSDAIEEEGDLAVPVEDETSR